MKLALLVSGRLGMEVLHKLVKAYYNISIVLTDRTSEGIINFCQRNSIPLFIGNPRNGKAHLFIKEFEIDVLLSVNYLFLIEKDLIEWPRLHAINFHGSLLPKYRGRTPHVWAIINNEKETGITAHLIDEGCDTGAIIDQISFPIDEEDTGATILDKYAILYPEFVAKVIEKVSNNDIKSIPQLSCKATYYGKRTPADGQINWEWQKERIRNWVRAQAFPYPGAFAFYRQQKIVINKVAYSDVGFKDNIPNGKILKIENGLPIVKTQNGALKILDYLSEIELDFQQDEMFL